MDGIRGSYVLLAVLFLVAELGGADRSRLFATAPSSCDQFHQLFSPAQLVPFATSTEERLLICNSGSRTLKEYSPQSGNFTTVADLSSSSGAVVTGACILPQQKEEVLSGVSPLGALPISDNQLPPLGAFFTAGPSLKYIPYSGAANTFFGSYVVAVVTGTVGSLLGFLSQPIVVPQGYSTESGKFFFFSSFSLVSSLSSSCVVRFRSVSSVYSPAAGQLSYKGEELNGTRAVGNCGGQLVGERDGNALTEALLDDVAGVATMRVLGSSTVAMYFCEAMGGRVRRAVPILAHGATDFAVVVTISSQPSSTVCNAPNGLDVISVKNNIVSLVVVCSGKGSEQLIAFSDDCLGGTSPNVNIIGEVDLSAFVPDEGEPKGVAVMPSTGAVYFTLNISNSTKTLAFACCTRYLVTRTRTPSLLSTLSLTDTAASWTGTIRESGTLHATRLTLTLSASLTASLTVSEDVTATETLTLSYASSVSPDFTASRNYASFSLSDTHTVSASDDVVPLEDEERINVRLWLHIAALFVTHFTSLVNVVTSGSGLFTAQVQVLGMMGRFPGTCIKHDWLPWVSYPRILSPMALSPTTAGMFLGNLLLVILVAGTQAFFVALDLLADDNDHTFMEALSAQHAPSVTFAVATTYLPTTTFLMFQLWGEGEYGLGFIGLIYLLLYFSSMVFVKHLLLSATCNTYSYDSFRNPKMKYLAFLFLPSHKWTPTGMRKAFGSFFQDLTSRNAFAPFFYPTIVLITSWFATFPICRLLLTALSMVFLSSMMLIPLLCKIYRCIFSIVVLFPIMGLWTLMMQIDHISVPFVFLFVIFFAVCHSLLVFILEKTSLKSLRLDPVFSVGAEENLLVGARAGGGGGGLFGDAAGDEENWDRQIPLLPADDTAERILLVHEALQEMQRAGGVVIDDPQIVAFPLPPTAFSEAGSEVELQQRLAVDSMLAELDDEEEKQANKREEKKHKQQGTEEEATRPERGDKWDDGAAVFEQLRALLDAPPYPEVSPPKLFVPVDL